jgi:hypothetical protein
MVHLLNQNILRFEWIKLKYLDVVEYQIDEIKNIQILLIFLSKGSDNYMCILP